MGGVCDKLLFSISDKKSIFELHYNNNEAKNISIDNINNKSIEEEFASKNFSNRINLFKEDSLFKNPRNNLNLSFDNYRNKKDNKFSILQKRNKSHFLNFSQVKKRSKSYTREIQPISSNQKKKNYERFIRKLQEFRTKNLIEDNLIERDFAVELFIQINKLRNNCLSYSKKIDFFSKFVEEIEGEKYLSLEMTEFISNSKLVEGLPAFKEAIKFLELYYKKYSSLKRLIHVSELKIPFPQDLKLVEDNNYIKNKAYEIQKKLKDKYEITGYTYDITYKDAELSTIMQIVDDNYGNKNRRNNLLNKDINYIGINHKQLNDEQYAVYILLAK